MRSHKTLPPLTSERISEVLAAIKPQGSAVVQQGALYVRKTVSSPWERIGPVGDLIEAVSLVNARLQALSQV